MLTPLPNSEYTQIERIVLSAPNRRLMTVDTAAFLMNSTRIKVESMIEDGSLSYGFNIAVPSAHRRVIRVLPKSVFSKIGAIADAPSANVIEVIGSFLPANQITLRLSQIAWLMACDGQHVANLVLEKCLVQFGEVHRPKVSPQVSRSNFAQFLISRRIQ